MMPVKSPEEIASSAHHSVLPPGLSSCAHRPQLPAPRCQWCEEGVFQSNNAAHDIIDLSDDRDVLLHYTNMSISRRPMRYVKVFRCCWPPSHRQCLKRVTASMDVVVVAECLYLGMCCTEHGQDGQCCERTHLKALITWARIDVRQWKASRHKIKL
jgi:hypothetical protein